MYEALEEKTKLIGDKIKNLSKNKKCGVFYSASNDYEQKFLPFFQIMFADTKFDINDNNLDKIKNYDFALVIKHQEALETDINLIKINDQIYDLIISNYDIEMSHIAQFLYNEESH